MTQIEPSKSKSNFQRMVLITVIVGTFLWRLDQTIVNLALPKIINDFGISVSAAGWIATAYILANAVFVPIWGKLWDTIGRKKVYLLGFAIFIFGSVLAWFAWNLSSMIVFRIIQAIAGSADYPTAMAILAVTFTGKERAQALWIWSASFAAASVFWPLIWWPLIDSFGWRSVFLINLPIWMIGMWMAIKYIHESVSEKKTVKFDWWGAITLGGALSALVLVLDKGLDWGWFSGNSLLSYAAIIIFSALFIVIERNHPEPIVDFKFFKIPAFVNTLINNFVVFMGLMGSIFLIPVFAQTFLGYDATQTGFLFMPLAFAMMLGAPLGGRLTGKVEPRYVIALSTLIASIALYWFSFLDPRSTALDIILPLSLMAFWLGFWMAQRTSIIAVVVPTHEIGMASSVLALARNVAWAFGIAVFGTILTNITESNVFKIASNTVINSTNPLDHSVWMALVSLKAQVSAYDSVFMTAAFILFIWTILALNIRVTKQEMEHTTEVHVE